MDRHPSPAVRHAQVVAGIAARHLELMRRVYAGPRTQAVRTFEACNWAAITEGWSSLGTIQDLHRQFDEALK